MRRLAWNLKRARYEYESRDRELAAARERGATVQSDVGRIKTICIPSPSGFRVHDFPAAAGFGKLSACRRHSPGRRFCRDWIFSAVGFLNFFTRDSKVTGTIRRVFEDKFYGFISGDGTVLAAIAISFFTALDWTSHWNSVASYSKCE